MNRLLERQLKKILGDAYYNDPCYQTKLFQEFLETIDQSYTFKDKEVRLLERTLDLSSQELNDANQQLKKQNEEIQRLATLDSLTGLSNRYVFNNNLTLSLKRAKRYNRKFSILFIDIDRFKIINDSLGHRVGDLLLKAIALRLKKCVRDSDTIARLGGDEFTILLEEVQTHADAGRAAQKLLNVLSRPYNIEGHELMITVSIGISTYPVDAANIVDLFKNADTAMYQAKESGRNNYKFYHYTMGVRTDEYMALESRMRRALENGEFELYYQPQLDLRTGVICGAEALIRWNSPEFGMISPLNFIPIAEETGMIIAIGQWVMRTAALQAKQWQKQKIYKSRISVNVSRRQLQDVTFVENAVTILELSDLNPKFFEMELTESTVMQRPKFTKERLQQLKAWGVYLSIDDFGTGYSSLGNLKQLTIDKLKIDRSFVRDLDHNPDAKPIIEAVIAMAHSLQLSVIAEGVETKEQLMYLKDKGCDQIQGYWLSKPVAAPVFEEMLRQRKKYI
jgi:diguanylate cyclase (GGDEF)-like protein